MRLDDNAGLYYSLINGPVLPIFIFDNGILDILEDRDDARISFIQDQTQNIRIQLEQNGSTLQIFHGRPLNILQRLLSSTRLKPGV